MGSWPIPVTPDCSPPPPLGPNAWLSVPVRGRKGVRQRCYRAVIKRLLSVCVNDGSSCLFTSGSDSSLEECLSLASRFFVVWRRRRKDEEMSAELRFRLRTAKTPNRSRFIGAELTNLFANFQRFICCGSTRARLIKSDCTESSCDVNLPPSLLNLVPAAELMGKEHW